MTRRSCKKVLALPFLCLVGWGSVFAQSTAFTYQGRLTDAGSPASGNYDLQFTLWDAGSGGNQLPLGSPNTIVKPSQPVAGGIFTVSLDFGGGVFTGADRFLEISVRHNSNEAFTPLSPRQQISSTPYAVRSLSAGSADSVAVNGVPAGSGNYIQNGTTQQTSSNFNISGGGTVGGTLTAGVVNATGQYNLRGAMLLNSDSNSNSLSLGFGAGSILAGGFDNVFVGNEAGKNNTAGHRNSFFGRDAGGNNSAGFDNSFFGALSGSNNAAGNGNAFFGAAAGETNSSGSFNSFFGGGTVDFDIGTGFNNTTGSFNSFFGHRAGEANVNGDSNSFFGTAAGLLSTSGKSNTFVGHDAGDTNTSGSFNTVIGEEADVSVGSLTNATAIGYRAVVNQSNSLVLGSISGINGCNNASNCADIKVGIGTTAPSFKLTVSDPANAGLRVETGTTGGTVASFGGNGDFSIDAPGIPGGRFLVDETGDARVGRALKISILGNAGTTNLCLDPATRYVSVCSSSLRYKQNVNSFSSGLSIVKRLHPVSFNWKANNEADMGLVAEDVAKVEPLLVTYNSKGEIEGVKYDRIAVVLINAVKEQQKQIAELRQEVQRLQIHARPHRHRR